MNRMDFTQAVVRIRVLEKKLLTKDKLRLLAETEDAFELWKQLETTPYGEYLEELENIHHYEMMLEKELEQVYKHILEISPTPKIHQVLTLKYDYHNLKVFCKETLLETDFSHLYLPYSLKGRKEEDFSASFRKKVAQVIIDYQKHKNPQRIDILFDHFYIDDLYEKVSNLDIPLFLDYVKTKIDFLNVRTLIRLKKQNQDLELLKLAVLDHGYISKDTILYSLHDSAGTLMRTFRKEKISTPLNSGLEAYQESNRLTEFEKEMENHLMGMIREAKNIHFGPEPLLAYALAKETEINNLRMIIISKLNEIQTDRIKQRMREGYV